MPRTAIYTPEEIKKRQADRVNKYIKERRAVDPEFRDKLRERSKKSTTKKNEELQKLREFYEANKINTIEA
jgi:tripartite-type tricarboxylate transporter receptor subunit TctC